MRYARARGLPAFGSTSNLLIAEDDAHRYPVQKDVMVALPDGGTVCALILRVIVRMAYFTSPRAGAQYSRQAAGRPARNA